VVAGCSASVPGVPSPAAGAATAAPVPAVGALALPPRPRELRLDGLDPCASLSSAQLAKLGLDRTVPSIPAGFGSVEGKVCAAGGFETKQVVATYTFVTHPGIEYVATGPAAAFGKFEIVQIAGFPGVVEPQQEDDACTVDADVAAGQFVNVQYRDASFPLVLSRAQLCQGATSVGDEVVDSLMKS
jgi:hypothetical protein